MRPVSPRLPLAALILALGLAAGPVAAESAPPRQIVVEGRGEVQRVPDFAIVAIGVTSEAATAAEALAANTAAMTEVFAALAAAGIEPRDIRTTEVGLAPRWHHPEDRRSEPRIVGFTASNQVAVRVRELARLGAVLDAVVQGGANRLGGVNFGLSDEAEALAEARRRAVADALARAQLYTTAAGVGLGRVMTITESGGFGIPRPFQRADMMLAAEAAPVPVAEGEMNISAGVSIVFELD